VLAGIPLSRLYPDRTELANILLVAVTETVTADAMDRFERAIGEALS